MFRMITSASCLAFLGCRPDASRVHVVGSIGDLPARPYTITYTLPGQAPFTLTLDSGVAAQDPLVPTEARGDGRGYVVEVDDPDCANDAVFNGVPHGLRRTDRPTTGSFTSGLPLSASPLEMRSDIALRVQDHRLDWHRFKGGVYTTTSGASSWTIEVVGSEYCFTDTQQVCQYPADPWTMKIEGDILVDPDPDHLFVGSIGNFMTDVATGERTCSAKWWR